MFPNSDKRQQLICMHQSKQIAQMWVLPFIGSSNRTTKYTSVILLPLYAMTSDHDGTHLLLYYLDVKIS